MDNALDMAEFLEIKKLLGDSFPELVSLCLENLPLQLKQLERAIKANEAEQIFTTAHSLKGSCITVCAKDLAAKAKNIENIARQGSTNNIEELFRHLPPMLDDVISDLKTLL